MNANTPTKTAPCPQCRKPASLATDNRFRPFCSERCKLIDLGEWFAEKHSIPVLEHGEGETESAAPQASLPKDRLQ